MKAQLKHDPEVIMQAAKDLQFDKQQLDRIEKTLRSDKEFNRKDANN